MQIYCIRCISWNIRQSDMYDNKPLVKSCRKNIETHKYTKPKMNWNQNWQMPRDTNRTVHRFIQARKLAEVGLVWLFQQLEL